MSNEDEPGGDQATPPPLNQPESPPQSYRPSDRELDILERMLARQQNQAVPRFKVTRDQTGAHLHYAHPHQEVGRILLSDALATTDDDFRDGIVRELASLSSQEDEINFLR